MSNFFQNEVNISGVAYLRQLLIGFEEGKVPLHVLSRRLDAARHGLIEPDTQWLAMYEKYWGAIEECNALALDAGAITVLPDDEAFLSKTVQEFGNFLRDTFPSCSASLDTSSNRVNQ